MKRAIRMALLLALTGCASVQLTMETENYQDKWIPVKEGDSAEYSGIQRIRLYVEDDDEDDGERAFSKSIQAQGLPAWVFVINSSLFRVAYPGRNRIEEWSHNPYRLEKTYTWKNYPDALPPKEGTAVSAGTPKTPSVPPTQDAPGTPPPTPQTPEQQYATGLKYQHGDGVAQNDAEAARWFRRAADRNHAGAQYSLGILCLNGWGVAKNENEARVWLRKAADQGHAQAQAKLAEWTPKPAADPPPPPPPEPDSGSTAPRLPDVMPD
jgi:TPR repeat protein